jgi:putative DNA primase/helicase
MSTPDEYSKRPSVTRLDEAIAKKAADKQAQALYLLTDSKGQTLPCEHNALVLLTKATIYDGLHYDEFLSRMRIGARDWLDADDLNTACWLQVTHGVARFTLAHARHAARVLAYSRRRDSLREFVDALPAWDGVPRIRMAFHEAWGAPDNALMQAASANFFIAMIARALAPGAQVDTLWAFEGPQGTLKSKALRVLGEGFHAEISAAIGTTDFQRELRGIWLAEMSELDSLRGREASTVKRLLSAPSDRFVQKYALHAESYPRRAVNCATTNEAVYWQDATGARRLIPIKCGEIRPDLIAAERLQWFAEARNLYAAGATWWEFPDSILAEQEARQCVDSWEDAIAAYLLTPGAKDDFDKQGRVPSSVILSKWLGLEPSRQGRVTGPRLGQVMRRLGFEPAQCGKSRARGWQRTDTDAHKQVEVF